MRRLALVAERISDPEYTKITTYFQGPVGYISMRSPKDLNCLSLEMLGDLSKAFRQL